jgi:hypothetical protein
MDRRGHRAAERPPWAQSSTVRVAVHRDTPEWPHLAPSPQVWARRWMWTTGLVPLSLSYSSGGPPPLTAIGGRRTDRAQEAPLMTNVALFPPDDGRSGAERAVLAGLDRCVPPPRVCPSPPTPTCTSTPAPGAGRAGELSRPGVRHRGGRPAPRQARPATSLTAAGTCCSRTAACCCPAHRRRGHQRAGQRGRLPAHLPGAPALVGLERRLS